MAEGVRFCRSADGSQLGYSSFGSGKPLVLMPGWWMSPDADRKRIIGRDFWSDLPAGRRTIAYDRRGVGVSSRVSDDVGLERQVEDLQALVDELELPWFDLLCFHDGAAAGITFAARFPGRVRRLALYNPWARVPGVIGRQHIAVWSAVIRADWGLASRCFAELLYPKGPMEAQESSTKAIRETQTPETALLYLEYVNSYDVRAELAKLDLPVLVISRQGPGRTPFVPLTTVQPVAAGIPGARLVVYDVAPAVCPYFEHGTYSRALRDFLADEIQALPLHPTLSAREIEVLRLVAQGKTNAQIAELLVISKNTADRHVSHILSKTGSSNRAEAVLYAARNGLVG